MQNLHADLATFGVHGSQVYTRPDVAVVPVRNGMQGRRMSGGLYKLWQCRQKLGKSKDDIPESQRPVVFLGPFEHHSNELWWRESIATVVAIGEDRSGRPDMEQLARDSREPATGNDECTGARDD